MCVTFIMLNPDAGAKQWQLVLINNRDEHYDRPSSRLSLLDGVWAGRDLKPGPTTGGTWLAFGETGRVGVLLNVLEPPEHTPPNPKGRGLLAINFAKSLTTPEEYLTCLEEHERHPGFALVLLQKTFQQDDKWRFSYLCNRGGSGIETLRAGTYGFGNSVRDRPFRKVQHGLGLFEQGLKRHESIDDKDQLIQTLLQTLTDRTSCFPDAQLQSQATHMDIERQKALSSCFVEFPEKFKYGTRTQSVILVDGNDNVLYYERTMNESNFKSSWEETKHEFKLKTPT